MYIQYLTEKFSTYFLREATELFKSDAITLPPLPYLWVAANKKLPSIIARLLLGTLSTLTPVYIY